MKFYQNPWLAFLRYEIILFLKMITEIQTYTRTQVITSWEHGWWTLSSSRSYTGWKQIQLQVVQQNTRSTKTSQKKQQQNFMRASCVCLALALPVLYTNCSIMATGRLTYNNDSIMTATPAASIYICYAYYIFARLRPISKIPSLI